MFTRIHLGGVKKVSTWLDKLTFPRILGFWLVIVLLFGFIYHYFPDENSSLYIVQTKTSSNSLGNSIYFSFVTATTTGFGDIVPLGYFKFIAIIEVIFGLLLLAIVTSKLVSIKQDSILTEIYDMSFHEKIGRVRSALLLFRQNIGNISNSIDEGIIKKKFIGDTEVYLTSFESILKETGVLIGRKKNNYYIKKMDDIDSELIFNSIILSFERITELITVFENNKVNWGSEPLKFQLNKCITLADQLFEDLKNAKIVGTNYFNDISARKIKVWQSIGRVQ